MGLRSAAASARFIEISLVYFIIGIIWMGIGSFFFPQPVSPFASEVYMTAFVHVMVLGWASFALMGILYHFVPKMRGKEEVHSQRLASVHFWVTNILFPIAVVLVTYASFVIDSFMASGVSEAAVEEIPAVSSLIMTFMVLVIIALGAQLAFVYNIYKTLQS
jgi:cbb3-type cytochrome oxidase subunit 1